MIFQIINLLSAVSVISINCPFADKAVITEVFKFAKRIISAVI
ncbi:hypothetical protein PA10_00301 [Pseudomonas phage pPa_SNUABM_DT01]|nr:hypothetical protein PA10_00301 [Pseudomonas phage pPa_SNUABM_DT01]